jgi:hypothetical protein
MRWLLSKLIIVACLVFGFFNYWVYFNGDKPPFLMIRDAAANFSWDKIFWGSVPSFALPQKIPSAISALGEKLNSGSVDAAKTLEDESAEAIKVYKWVDASGVINYAQNQPEGVSAQVLAVYRNTNILQSQAVVSPKTQPKKESDELKAAALPTESPMSPMQIKTLFDDAYKVRAQMESHNQGLEQIINANVKPK